MSFKKINNKIVIVVFLVTYIYADKVMFPAVGSWAMLAGMLFLIIKKYPDIEFPKAYENILVQIIPLAFICFCAMLFFLIRRICAGPKLRIHIKQGIFYLGTNNNDLTQCQLNEIDAKQGYYHQIKGYYRPGFELSIPGYRDISIGELEPVKYYWKGDNPLSFPKENKVTKPQCTESA